MRPTRSGIVKHIVASHKHINRSDPISHGSTIPSGDYAHLLGKGPEQGHASHTRNSHSPRASVRTSANKGEGLDPPCAPSSAASPFPCLSDTKTLCKSKAIQFARWTIITSIFKHQCIALKYLLSRPIKLTASSIWWL
jgi:hypothetical protein